MDECSLSNTATISYKWSTKGKQPRIETKQRGRERETFFGCVNPLNGQVIAQSATKGNARTFKSFLKKILRKHKNKGKVIIVLDNVRYHHAKMLKPFLMNNREKLELIFLPPYSPDLNPIERVWWFMRKHITHNRTFDSLKIRKIHFWKFMSQYQKPNVTIKKICIINN